MQTDFLAHENARNKQHAALYERLLREAWGANYSILVGHHVAFEADGDIGTEDEIPSADTLLFDHGIMKAVFGEERAMHTLAKLATLPASEREDYVLRALAYYEEADRC